MSPCTIMTLLSQNDRFQNVNNLAEDKLLDLYRERNYPLCYIHMFIHRLRCFYLTALMETNWFGSLHLHII